MTGWIPVSERLPEHMKSVLIWMIGPQFYGEPCAEIASYNARRGQWGFPAGVKTVTAVFNGAGVRLPKGEAAILAACIQYPNGLQRNQLTVLTGFKRSTRDAYIQRLRERGFVQVGGDGVAATADGIAALPDAEPLPRGTALQQHWFARLPEGESKILRVLVEQYPDSVERDDLTSKTDYKRSTRDAYLQRLAAKELVEEAARGQVRASESLFS